MKKVWHSINEEPVVHGESVRIAFMARRSILNCQNPKLFYTCLDSVHLTGPAINWERHVRALGIEQWAYWDELTNRLDVVLYRKEVAWCDGKDVLTVGFAGTPPLSARIPKIGDTINYPTGKPHRVVGVRYSATAERAELHVDVVPIGEEKTHQCSNCHYCKDLYYNDDKDIPAHKCTNPKFNSPYVSEDGTCYDWHSKDEVKQ